MTEAQQLAWEALNLQIGLFTTSDLSPASPTEGNATQPVGRELAEGRCQTAHNRDVSGQPGFRGWQRRVRQATCRVGAGAYY